ncbi:MAG: uroporphyrinogen decarboxylase family protein [Methanolobus sp.]
MLTNEMTSMERVLTSLDHREADRVPYFLLLTTQGSRQFGISIEQYFSDPKKVASAQISMQKRYGHDCYYSFYYASLEIEAWGGSTIFYKDSSPNSGMPPVHDVNTISSLEAPDVNASPQLQKVLKTTSILKEHAGEDIPIVGVVMSPFALPSMQMGLEHYFDLIYEDPETFRELMKINEEFCVQWANVQLEAGATVICYFDPISSSTMIPPELYRKTGFKVAKSTLPGIKGPTATHMASGKCLPIIDDIIETGTAIVCTSVLEDLADVKKACAGKISVLGNLNGIEMKRWSRQDAESRVKEAIDKAASGGGYILSDNHGEIPFSVPADVLMDISSSVEKWGYY